MALALHAPWAHASTFEGQIVADGVPLATATPDAYVYGYAYTANSGSSTFEGAAASGYSRVSATSDGSVGKLAVQSTLVYRQTVTNPYATAQNVAFNFYIPRSRTTISLGYGTNIQTFTAVASFLGNISWGGDTAWQMEYGLAGIGSAPSTSVSLNAIGPVLSASASGFTVGGLQGGFYISSDNIDDVPVTGLAGDAYVLSDPYAGYLELGVIGANASVELTYTLTASATFDATYRDNSSAGAYGYGGFAQAGGYDPFGIEFAPDPIDGGIQLVFTQAVPEPATYGLLLAGLMAVGAATRRRRQGPATD
jgi:hypothetical protein